MKIISWNVRGLGCQIKWASVKKVIRQSRADIVLLQETKLSVVSDIIVKEVWGYSSARWMCCESVGASRGILLIRNRKNFIARDQWVGSYSMSVLLEDVGRKGIWMFTSVYGPKDRSQHQWFWDELNSVLN